MNPLNLSIGRIFAASICPRTPSLKSDRRFTQKERDNETRLDYFGARYFSSTQGRFINVDTGPFTPVDPQNWNRYSYVQNNPLKFVDPTGRTLTLTGTEADALVAELEKKTGYKLKRNSKTGLVTIDKGDRNKKGTSKELAGLLKDIIGDKKTDVKAEVGRDQTGAYFDREDKKQIDIADYKAIDAAAPEFAAASIGHVLKEYYEEAKDPTLSPFAAHTQALDFEAKVLSEYTGKKEQSPGGGYINLIPKTSVISRHIYTTVTYDVLLKTGGSAYLDRVDKVTKIVNRKPGQP
jgi:RHS repeat-associated protein